MQKTLAKPSRRAFLLGAACLPFAGVASPGWALVDTRATTVLGSWYKLLLELIRHTGMHWGVVAALIAVIFAYITFSRHILGFNIKLTGQSPRAAAFSGVNPGRLILICMGVSGALAGLAGLFEVSGPSGQITIDFNVGYGFTAIIVAFLGRLHPVGILLAGLLMALTYIGGEMAQLTLALPGAAIQIFQGMLLFFLLGFDVLTNYRPRLIRRGVV